MASNTNSTGGPTFGPNSVTLTDDNAFEARSAFFNTPQSIGQFSASFVYQATSPAGNTLADGATFMLQDAGLSALGGNGSGLGMAGVTPSAAVEFNVFTGHVVGTNFETNGANSLNYFSTTPVGLTSGNPIRVDLTYNGSILTENLTDTVTSSTFSISYATNLSSVLGSTALVGFTGATGGSTSLQTISEFTFRTAAVPEPGSLVLMGISVVVMASYGCRRRRMRAS